jgi:hypothetical protein
MLNVLIQSEDQGFLRISGCDDVPARPPAAQVIE